MEPGRRRKAVTIDSRYLCYEFMHPIFQHIIEKFIEKYQKQYNFRTWESTGLELIQSSVSDIALEGDDFEYQRGGHAIQRKRLHCRGTDGVYLIGGRTRIDSKIIERLLETAKKEVRNEKEIIKKTFFPSHLTLKEYQTINIRILDINIDNYEVKEGIIGDHSIKYTEKETEHASTLILTYTIDVTYAKIGY